MDPNAFLQGPDDFANKAKVGEQGQMRMFEKAVRGSLTDTDEIDLGGTVSIAAVDAALAAAERTIAALGGTISPDAREKGRDKAVQSKAMSLARACGMAIQAIPDRRLRKHVLKKAMAELARAAAGNQSDAEVE